MYCGRYQCSIESTSGDIKGLFATTAVDGRYKVEVEAGGIGADLVDVIIDDEPTSRTEQRLGDKDAYVYMRNSYGASVLDLTSSSPNLAALLDLQGGGDDNGNGNGAAAAALLGDGAARGAFAPPPHVWQLAAGRPRA